MLVSCLLPNLHPVAPRARVAPAVDSGPVVVAGAAALLRALETDAPRVPVDPHAMVLNVASIALVHRPAQTLAPRAPTPHAMVTSVVRVLQRTHATAAPRVRVLATHAPIRPAQTHAPRVPTPHERTIEEVVTIAVALDVARVPHTALRVN